MGAPFSFLNPVLTREIRARLVDSYPFWEGVRITQNVKGWERGRCWAQETKFQQYRMNEF